MKTRYTILVFALMILAGLCFTTCNNPIMEKWWENGSGGGSSGRSTTSSKLSYAYVVTFEANGGSYVDKRDNPITYPVPQTIIPGGRAQEPGLLVKGNDPNNLYLGGWYTDSACTDNWDFATDVVLSDMTLYAKWDSSGYKVVFDLQSMAESKLTYVPVTEYISAGAKATEPQEFGLTNSSYGSFGGWYTDAACSPINKWNFATKDVTSAVLNADTDSNGVADTLTLYASWLGVPKEVIFKSDGAKEGDPPTQYIATNEYAVTPFPVTKSGYAFAGWYKPNGVGSFDIDAPWDFAATPVTADITLYALWVPEGEVLIPGDTYQPSGSGPTATLSSFFIGEAEVTNKEFREVMGYTPSNWKDDNRPVNQVTWFDAVIFCNNLSIDKGLTPCYTIGAIDETNDAGTPFITNIASVTVDITKNGYRLPTEAEWEYAARGGKEGIASPSTYSGGNTADEVAWFYTNANETHDVKTKKANNLGLYDMSGNVSEWCWDWYGTPYPSSNSNPLGPTSPTKELRVRRGGSWNHQLTGIKPVTRASWEPSPFYNSPPDTDLQHYWTIGFRVGRSVRVP